MITKLSCVVFALAGLSAAQTPLSLEQAIRTVQQRPELRSANQRVDAAEQVRRQSGLIPNPRLFLQSENIRSSDFDYARDADTYAFFTQMLETSGRRGGRLAVASQEIERRRLESEQLRREIGFRVRDAYWNASAARIANELYDQSDAYFKQILGYHEARFREGKLAEVDLLRVRFQAEQMRAAAANARLRLDRAQLDLARILVTGILFFFLGNVRAAILTAMVIPLSMLVSFLGMCAYGISANLMSLGAIDFGMIVDGAIVMMENSIHRLETSHTSESPLDAIRRTAHEIARPMVFGVAIIIAVYLPILFLQGLEGRLFRPMAITVCAALIGSLLLALTAIPVLTSFASAVMAERIWTGPEQPCEIEFIERTPHRRQRHAEFRRLLPRSGEK
jgi:hypothetical protein